MYLNGNNYQIKGEWKDGEGASYFGYAETKDEAKEMIDLLAKREDCSHIERWQIINRRRGGSETYQPTK